MKKQFPVLVLAALASLFILSSSAPKPIFSTPTQPDSVYLCMGRSAYAYHVDSTCKYLHRCGDVMKKESLSKAKALERQPCKACTKQ